MRTFNRDAPGDSYRVRLVYGNGYERLCGPWEKLATAKSIRTREVNYANRYTRDSANQIAESVIERATGWEPVP